MVKLPKKFPKVATSITEVGFISPFKQATKAISEAIGMIVADKKLAINKERSIKQYSELEMQRNKKGLIRRTALSLRR